MTETINKIVEGLSVFHHPGEVIEVRFFNVPKGQGKYIIPTVSGYFDNLEKATQAIKPYVGRVTIYQTLNPINQALLGRAHNRLIERPKATTADQDVIARRWLPIDTDPVRPSGISASDEELSVAIDRRDEIVNYLGDEWGWPVALKGMSGNGGHALYRLDLPNDDESKILIEGVLNHLAKRFDDDRVEVDTSIFNAGRIWKMYGTVACKGDPLADRPHRLAKVTQYDPDAPIIPLERLRVIAPTFPGSQKKEASQDRSGHSGYRESDLIGALDVLGVSFNQKKDTKGRTIFALNRCLTSDAHSDGAAITLEDGKAGYVCHHNTCSNQGWQDVKSKLFPDGVKFSRNGAQPEGPSDLPTVKDLIAEIDNLPDEDEKQKAEIFAIANRSGHLGAIDWINLRDHLRSAGDVTKADLERIHKEANIKFIKCGRAEQIEETPEELAAKLKREAAEHYKLAKGLLNDPSLFGYIGDTITALGLAGDVKPALIIYLAVTSRLLERPQNIHVSAESAIGKSKTVETVLELFPPEEIYVLKAGSSRALVYTEEGFENRVIYIAEADSIPEDGPAASAVRALAADNYMAYDVVERDEETGAFGVRHIVKPGPTGLVTTSTKNLRQQMSTRMLEINLSDSEEQTRAILQAHASQVQAGTVSTVDLDPFLAMQRWLTLAGNRKVVIPFAGILAELLTDQAARSIRMRRDFRQLLTCIQSLALLYQAQRETTAEGAIIATIEDYAKARDLLEPIFTTIVSEGVTDAVRETVLAVQKGEEVSQAELCRRLDLSKSTVYWRVRRALYGGWLVNNEERKGYAAKLSLGTPLPDEVPALPLPEKLIEAFECSNANREDIPPILHTYEVENEEDIDPIYHPETDSNTRTPPPPPPVDEVRTVNSNPDEADNGSNSDSNARTEGEALNPLFTRAEIERVAEPASDGDRWYIPESGSLWFDEDGRLWDGDEKPLQGTLRWLRGQLK